MIILFLVIILKMVRKFPITIIWYSKKDRDTNRQPKFLEVINLDWPVDEEGDKCGGETPKIDVDILEAPDISTCG